MRSRFSLAPIAACFALLLPLASGSPARAAELPLGVELHRGVVADYGSVWVDEDPDGGLSFEIVLKPQVLGKRAELRQLYFNLDGEFTGLAVVEAMPETARHWLHRGRGWLRAAGARFDLGVAFWTPPSWLKRSWRRGRLRMPPPLQEIRFRLVADQVLSLEDLLPMSIGRKGEPVQVAVRVRNAALRGRPCSVVVGGLFLPEPEAEEEDEEPTQPPGDPGGVPPGCELLIDLITGEPVLVCP